MDRTVVSIRIKQLEKWDTNEDGRISCDELKKAVVKNPINLSHDAYLFMNDGDCDGTVC